MFIKDIFENHLATSRVGDNNFTPLVIIGDASNQININVYPNINQSFVNHPESITTFLLLKKLKKGLPQLRDSPVYYII